MPRRMSCALTTPQVRARIKTETSRHPDTWINLKPGDPLTLIEKGMGLKKGEKQVVLAEVRCTANYLEPLDQITPEAVAREGFPNWTPAQFIEFYCREKGGAPGQMRRVIRWEYLDEPCNDICKNGGNVSEKPNELDDKGFVFIGNDGNPYRCCIWGNAPWLFKWRDGEQQWESIRKLTQMDVFMLPHNLSQEQQEHYFNLEAKAMQALLPAPAAEAESNCLTCGGKGEVSAYMLDGDTDYIPCPDCVSKQLNGQLATTKQRLAAAEKALKEIQAGALSNAGNCMDCDSVATVASQALASIRGGDSTS